MSLSSKVFLVIPCYNEAARLSKENFRQQLQVNPHLQLIFVDDGSQDLTASILKEFCREHESRTTLISYTPNKGKAEAVRLGLNYALDHWHPDIVGFWDADLATPLEELAGFLQVFANRPDVQMVFGARVKLLGRRVVRIPVRHYLGRVFATCVSQLLRMPIYDTQCGAKLFRVSPDLRQALAAPFLSKWVFDVELIARFLRMYNRQHRSLGQEIYEYPLSTWIDVAGSKVRPKHFFVAVVDVLRIASELYLGTPASHSQGDLQAASSHQALDFAGSVIPTGQLAEEPSSRHPQQIA